MEATESKLQQRSLPEDRIAKHIPVDKRRAMGDVFDRWRLNQGWNPWDDTTQEMAITSWVHSLDREHVPASAYSELYELTLVRRASALQAGKTIPSFGVELMIACWSGDWGLRAELKQREIDAGRTLGENAESVCQLCLGTGFQSIERYGYQGMVKCDHQP